MMFLAYMPFRDPLLGGWNWWYLTLIPLALLIALVYKAMRCEEIKDIPAQALRAFLKMIGAFIACALVLYAIVVFLERS